MDARVAAAPAAATGRLLAGADGARPACATGFDDGAVIAGPAVTPSGLAAVAAVPARDEAERLPDCLVALAASLARLADPAAILLLVNDSTDGTAAAARALAPRLPVALVSREVRLPPGRTDAGHARRVALDLAAAMAARDGILLSTDADTRVAPDWARRLVARVRAGAGLACGAIRPAPAEMARLSPRLRRMARAEAALARAQDGLWKRLVPGEPRAIGLTPGGASLAMGVGAYRAAGGVPARPAREDRALAAAMAACGERVVAAPEAVAVTSCRLDGRASDGMARTLARRAAGEDLCDEGLLPLDEFLERTLAFRRAHPPAPAPAPATRRLTVGEAERDARLAAALARAVAPGAAAGRSGADG